jgi:hypothetical protein
MGRYEDDRARQIERENAEVVHVIETPLRILMDLGKWLVVGSLVLIMCLVNQVGWIVDLGERSQRGRVEHNNQVEGQHLQGDDFAGIGKGLSVFDIDFRTQPNPATQGDVRYNRFWLSGEGGIPPENDEGDSSNAKMKAFTLLPIGNGWGDYPDHAIPYCMAALYLERPTDFFNDTPGSWWTRNDDALDRKSARMQRDYEVAAMMTAALRSTLAHMKLGRPVSEVHSPLYEDNYLHRTAVPGYCDADSAAHDPQYGVAGTRAYRATLLRINLQHAPVVRFRWVYTGENRAREVDDAESARDGEYVSYKDEPRIRSEADHEIWGMCLPDSCSEGLGRGTTLYADLFASHAPLTDEQMLAENAILSMATKEFWEQAARENGITDLTSVEEVRKRAVHDLDMELCTTDFRV